MNAKTKKAITMKCGEIVEAGAPVSFIKDVATHCLVQGNRAEPYRVRVTSAFKAPSIKTLERQSNDGIVSSILGERVEPDGWDQYGSPSWLLALGVI